MDADEPSAYQQLGVEPTATTREIHDAYRRLAALFHPDRQRGATEADRRFAERRMREINRAWTILQDPGRRRDHDLERLSSRRHTSSTPTGVDPSDDGERHVEPADEALDDGTGGLSAGTRLGLIRGIPWIGVVVLLIAIAIGTAYADRAPSPADRPIPAEPVGVGACIDISTGPSTTVVPCDGPHQHVIVDRVPEHDGCPAGTEARRLGTDGWFDCLVEGSTPSG